jgi:hypothetical protein
MGNKNRRVMLTLIPATTAREKPKKSLHPFRDAGSYILATTYSRKTCRQTTIGAIAFHFRVRDGNGWFRSAMVTRTGTANCDDSGGRVIAERRVKAGAGEL